MSDYNEIQKVLQNIYNKVDSINEHLNKLPSLDDIEEIKTEFKEIKTIKDELNTLKDYFSEGGFFSKAGRVTQTFNSLYTSIEKLSENKISLLVNGLDENREIIQQIQSIQETFSKNLDLQSSNIVDLKKQIHNLFDEKVNGILEVYNRNILNNIEKVNSDKKRGLFKTLFDRE